MSKDEIQDDLARLCLWRAQSTFRHALSLTLEEAQAWLEINPGREAAAVMPA